MVTDVIERTELEIAEAVTANRLGIVLVILLGLLAAWLIYTKLTDRREMRQAQIERAKYQAMATKAGMNGLKCQTITDLEFEIAQRDELIAKLEKDNKRLNTLLNAACKKGGSMIQIKEFRESRKLSPREIVEVVQEDAPRFDRYLLSKCEHPEKYGIRLLNEIEQNLAEAFPLTVPEARKPDRRKNPCRLYCRVGKRMYGQLQRALQADGFKTTQDGLVYIISKYLEGRDGAEEETAHV